MRVNEIDHLIQPIIICKKDKLYILLNNRAIFKITVLLCSSIATQNVLICLPKKDALFKKMMQKVSKKFPFQKVSYLKLLNEIFILNPLMPGGNKKVTLT